MNTRARGGECPRIRVGEDDRVTCATVARRAPGGPPKAEPGAEAGPAAARSGATLIS
jgi:hypothetical protein